MKGGGVRRWLLLLPFTLCLLPFLGCGALGPGGGRTAPGAHTVFLAREGCATFVARTLGRDFMLAEAADLAYTPTLGDVLGGPTREGRSVFALHPTGSPDAGSPSGPPAANVPLDVLAVGLSLAEARTRLDAACGPPP